MLTAAISMRANTHQAVVKNICLAQDEKHCDYNWHHPVDNKIEVGQKVFLKNQRRMDRKGGTFSFKLFFSFTFTVQEFLFF